MVLTARAGDWKSRNQEAAVGIPSATNLEADPPSLSTIELQSLLRRLLLPSKRVGKQVAQSNCDARTDRVLRNRYHLSSITFGISPICN
jgi:hypothetical protein